MTPPRNAPLLWTHKDAFSSQWQKSLQITLHLCFQSRIHDSEFRLFYQVATQVLFPWKMVSSWSWNLFWFQIFCSEFVVPLSKHIIVLNACFSTVVFTNFPFPQKAARCYKDEEPYNNTPKHKHQTFSQRKNIQATYSIFLFRRTKFDFLSS